MLSSFIRRVVLFALLLACVSTVSAAQKVSVLIRVDDLFSINSPIMPREIDGFLQVVEKHGAHVSLAAIPNRLLQPTNENGAMSAALLDYANRGHQIIQHGYNHMCPYTGNSAREFSTTDSLAMISQKERIEKIAEGRRLLEAVIGRPITAYCGPGADDEELLPLDAPLLREAGFMWLKNAPADTPIFHPSGGASYPVMLDFAWQLTEENYQERLRMVQDYCRKTVAEGNVCNIKLHDPFTRANYENGVTLRWIDEVLTWIETQPGWDVDYTTLDEYYAKMSE